ncbi:MAG: DUF58 domain-containing protein [Planctomycetota bacterium]
MIDPEILRQVRRIQVRTSRLVTDVMAGGYNSVFRGSGIEFDEVREYSEGDDPRTVDWNVTARTGRPHVKKFVEERELTVLFLLDLSASMRAGFVRRSARDAAAELCACLALSAIRNNDKVGLIAFTDRIERYVPAKKGIGHVLRIVRDCLAHEPAGTQTNMTAALEFAGRVVRRKSILFLVSDFQTGSEDEKTLRIVSRRHDVIAARLLFPEAQILTNTRNRGLIHFRDYETGRELVRDFSSAAVRAAFANNLEQWRKKVDDRFRRARIDVMDVPVELPVVDPILKFFRKRESRAAHG